jgi:hypothetical protein
MERGRQLAVVATAVLAFGAAGWGGPSEAELRQQGYTDRADWEDYVAPQMNDPTVECIEDGELIEFGDSSYYTGICPDPNWC